MIDFEDLKFGRYLRVTFFNNSKRWKDQNAGRTSVSEISVGERIPPSTVLPSTLKTLRFDGHGLTQVMDIITMEKPKQGREVLI